MPECAKTHLQQSKFQNFPGEHPVPPSSRGGAGKGGEEREGKGKGRREGRQGRDGKGRRAGGEEWGCWGGEGRSTWAPP